MLSLVLAVSMGVSPVLLFPEPDPNAPTLNERLFGTDPAIQAEVNKINHTKHYISLSLGGAFVLSSIAMFHKDNNLGGFSTLGMGFPILLYGGMGLLNLSE